MITRPFEYYNYNEFCRWSGPNSRVALISFLSYLKCINKLPGPTVGRLDTLSSAQPAEPLLLLPCRSPGSSLGLLPYFKYLKHVLCEVFILSLRYKRLLRKDRGPPFPYFWPLFHFLNVRLGCDQGLVWKQSVYSECRWLGLRYGLCSEFLMFSLGFSAEMKNPFRLTGQWGQICIFNHSFPARCREVNHG